MNDKNKKGLIYYKGFFRKQLSLSEGIALLLSGVIGAGILAIPYAIAQVGLTIGLFYIFGLGTLMMGLHLMLGEVTVRTKQELQLGGLAKKYLGTTGWLVMSLMTYLLLFGVLVVYLIGIGETLATLFGKTPFFWTIIAFTFLSLFVSTGLKQVKKAELFLELGLLCIVVLIAVLGFKDITIANLSYMKPASLLVPYGIVLFAFHGSSVIPEIHTTLAKNKKQFKKSIVLGYLLIMFIYALFAFVTVGVSGVNTTEIATIGLGQQLGLFVFWLSNIFAVIAMVTSFMMTGISLKDSLMWDNNIPSPIATVLTLGIPLFIFVLGLRGFISALNVVGGIFGSIEMFLILMIYWKAKQMGDLPVGKYKLHHTVLIGCLLVVALSIGTIFSVMSLI